MKLSFEIVTPDGQKTAAEVYEVILPTPEGHIAVLPHHTELVTLVAPGVISIRYKTTDPNEKLEHLATTGGFAEISGQHVRILTDSAERADDINEVRVQEALTAAQNLRRTAKDTITLADATALIEQNAARLKVATLKRRSRRP